MSKSSIVRGASKAASIWNKLDTAVQAIGGTESTLDILDREEGETLVHTIAKMLVQTEPSLYQWYPVEVDHEKSLEETINFKRYSRVHKYLKTENFPTGGRGAARYDLTLLEPVSAGYAAEHTMKELNTRGLKPARIEHLLALDATYPELLDKFHIVAPGSLMVNPYGRINLPCLYSHQGLYHFEVISWGVLEVLDSEWRILAVAPRSSN